MLAQRASWSKPFFALVFAWHVCSAEVVAAQPAFLGKDSCASSGCHGGAAQNQNQSLIWSRQDQHSRAPATLTTARSKRLAQILKIPDPARDYRCTSCHAPWQNLAPGDLPAEASPVREAVSCESCHGPAENYLRSHTRKDLNRSEKLADGLRDLTVLYNRANSCVACHQRVDSRLLEAGHPELLFELDGQTAAMPRHWRESDGNTHAGAWLTGQAAALRELTAQLASLTNQAGSERIFVQWQSALWVINASLANSPLGEFDTNSVASAEKMEQLHRAADRLAAGASKLSGEQERSILQMLAQVGTGFASGRIGSLVYAARAERLALAVDRLLYALPKERAAKVRGASDTLFQLVQSRPDFDPKRFGEALAVLINRLEQP